MRKYFLSGIIAIFLALLISCAHRPIYNTSQIQQDLVSEHWQSQVVTSPPNQSMQGMFSDSQSARVMRQLPSFTRVHIEGNYHVKIVGNQPYHRVSLSGRYARLVVVEVVNGILCIHPIANCDVTCLQEVTICIELNTLNELVTRGNIRLEGQYICSDHLSIRASGSGCVFLRGNFNLSDITQVGSSDVTVLNAHSPRAVIYDYGNGNVDVSGDIAINHIIHAGNGRVSVIGADSPALAIDASGAGLTSVAGCVNLKRISAINYSRVYVSGAKSLSTTVSANDCAKVGIEGTVRSLNVCLAGSSQFLGKNYLSRNADASTKDAAHANVRVNNRVFASASDNSSIYLFGRSRVDVSRYTAERGVIIPLWSDEIVR